MSQGQEARLAELEQKYRELAINSENTITTLMRDLSRISLAGDGISPALDKLFNELRRKVRINAEPDNIHQLCDQITDKLKDIESEHTSHTKQLVQTLNDFIGALNPVKLPKKLNIQYKDLIKKTANSRKESDITKIHELFSQFLRELQSYLNEEISNQPSPPSWWQQLFSKASSDDTGETPTERTSETSTDSITHNRDKLAPATLVQALRDLLTNIVLTKEHEPDKQSLLARVHSPLPLDSLSPLISEIARLINIALDQEKIRQERFLSNLTEKLESMTHFLEDNQKQSAEALADTSALQDSVTKNINELKQDIKTADSLASLQTTVDTKLDSITDALVAYKTKQESQIEIAEQRLSAMQRKLVDTAQSTEVLQKKLQEERGAAYIDPLTQICNRKAYEEHFTQCYEQFQSTQSPTSLVMCDIDFFKQINDTHGHAMGDAVLKNIATLLKNNVRKSDFVARFGGEEFALLLDGASLEQAVDVAQKLRELISNWRFTAGETELAITMSFGVATFAEQDSQETLFERADKALYSAKQNGRNCVKSEQPLT